MAGENSIVLAVPEPPPTDIAWKWASEAVRLQYYKHAADIALSLKQKEIRKGVDVDGKPLRPVQRASRPDGATGPPLTPHYAESRTRKWLRASIGIKAGTVTLWWSHGWGTILGYHARKEVIGAPERNVIGLTSADEAKFNAEMRAYWRRVQGGGRIPTPPTPRTPTRPRTPTLPRPEREIAARHPEIAPYLVKPPTPRPVPRPSPAEILFRPLAEGPRVKPTAEQQMTAAWDAEVLRAAAQAQAKRGVFGKVKGWVGRLFGRERPDLSQKPAPPKPPSEGKFAPLKPKAPKVTPPAPPAIASPLPEPAVPKRPYYATQPYGLRQAERDAAAAITAKLDAYEAGDRKVAALRELGAYAAVKQARVDHVNKLYAETEAAALRYAEAAYGGPEHLAALDELRSLRVSLGDARYFAERATAANREAALAVLKAEHPMEFRVNVHNSVAADARESVTKAMDFLGSIVGKGTHDAPVEVTVRRPGSRGAGRAYYEEGAVRLHKDSGVETAAHEIGHLLEDKVPGWLDAARAFLGKRTMGEPFVPLRETDAAYTADEYGRKDRFEEVFGDDAMYVGKYYHDGTEITSMGLEQLMADPAGFAHKDPEFAKFLIGLLHGHIR